MYGSSYIFGITLPSSGSVPSAFLEMLNWGAVNRILWMGTVDHSPVAEQLAGWSMVH
jgi:hypothetical protein